MAKKTLTEHIKTDTGMGGLNALHVTNLTIAMSIAFDSKDCILVVYINEKQEKIIYLMPTEKPNRDRPALSESIALEKWNEKKEGAFKILENILTNKLFATLPHDYKLTICHILPKEVMQSPSVLDLDTSDIPQTC